MFRTLAAAALVALAGPVPVCAAAAQPPPSYIKLCSRIAHMSPNDIEATYVMDRMREELRQQHGEMDIAVDLIREIRDEG